MHEGAHKTTTARGRLIPAASAWLVSVALHAALITGASYVMWGELVQRERELVVEVGWVEEAPRAFVAPEPEPLEPPRVEDVSATPEPELVLAALPEYVADFVAPPRAPEPEISQPLADASDELDLALSTEWTPRPGSRASGGVGVGSGGAGATGTGPRSVSGSGAGALEGTGSGDVAVTPPKAAQAGDGVVARAPVVTAAVLVASPRPEYPRASLRLGEQGSVVLRLHVEADGRVSAADVLETSGFARLDEAASAGVLAWRFKPATRDGAAIATLEPHRVTFRLSDAPR